MKVAFFGSKDYTREFFERCNQDYDHELRFFEPTLTAETAGMADGYEATCIFVNDTADRPALKRLREGGTRVLALRCAGFNQVDLQAAEDLEIPVVRVPAYSPHAVAEHTLALLLSLNRKIHRAWNRVREGNFELSGLLGFDLAGKTAGVIGTGRIGACVARLLNGFGCEVLAYDPYVNEEITDIAEYVDFDEMLARSRILTIHAPLTPETHHLIDAEALKKIRPGLMLLNTSRGKIIHTPAVLEALKDGRVSALGLDVYEEEDALFFSDLSNEVIQDDVFARLLTMPNVLVTAHQAFFTQEALENIACDTLGNLSDFQAGRELKNRVRPGEARAG
jgi:D-lactate dehydrogenase